MFLVSTQSKLNGSVYNQPVLLYNGFYGWLRKDQVTATDDRTPTPLPSTDSCEHFRRD